MSASMANVSGVTNSMSESIVAPVPERAEIPKKDEVFDLY
jgi:hypothetical protein